MRLVVTQKSRMPTEKTGWVLADVQHLAVAQDGHPIRRTDKHKRLMESLSATKKSTYSYVR